MLTCIESDDKAFDKKHGSLLYSTKFQAALLELGVYTQARFLHDFMGRLHLFEV